MTTEEKEKAKAYAEKAYYPAPEYGWYESDHEAMTDVLEQAYLAGATEALASQWKEIERDKDGFTTDECLDTMFQELPILLWHNTDEDGEYVDRTKWADYAGDIQCDYHHYSLYMPIPTPPLKGGDA